ncbi:MAG: outer membrane protein assembly factor BamE [Jannaschia helgolandensis]|jgi:outer membrane protein assembly factor BamE (lipoprotein component of BamABCDE complex)|uniref:Beta-barrel assembly machine subunit BamE n=3 Tax=Jannaschia helgolandensis TaxID=188906 RepID=A0A1H7N601_9RHOB|nr:Beta-barrel assembly machine subunit BamE [Jannaschia helgolandensis]|tara:strand:+ start:305 stop:781 length:477 start_codon:yes stop_codon:yes gene_type:complete
MGDKGLAMGKIVKALCAALLMVGLSACAATYRNHGYVPTEVDLQSLVVGRDTRATVEQTIGRPSTNGVERDDSWYYIQSRVKNFAYRAPKVESRELVAISFSENGTLANIERFGLERGRVVPLSRRVTETSIRDFGLIQQIIRNFGRINVGQTLDDSP